MSKNDHIECMGYPVFNGLLGQLPRNQKLLINTLNQYSYCIAEKDPVFRNALLQSDVLLPDGIAIVMAARLLKGKKIKKIAGANLHHFLLDKLNEERGSCFYLGSSKKTLKKIKRRITKEYPNIRIGCYAPPFKHEFSAEDNANMLQATNDFAPNILFVGMTAPKQEKWTFAHKDALNADMICSIGAVFDFFAGTVKRPGKNWVDLGLEWLGRLTREPKRMWKRYIYYGVIFVYYLFREKLRPRRSEMGQTLKEGER